MAVKTISKFASQKIERQFGYLPSQKQKAIRMMMRRGVGYIRARQSVTIVSAATASQRYEAWCIGMRTLSKEGDQ